MIESSFNSYKSKAGHTLAHKIGTEKRKFELSGTLSPGKRQRW